ncbi:MAG: hypothetical protein QOK19_1022 [Solirubrobacteraceae bacterium]|nr:hypothetical protein [Solirubrobacteraceae bacterium]
MPMATREHGAGGGELTPAVRQWCSVAVATVLVAGCPVVAVWWLRASATVTSTPLALGLGMALSLLASYLGQLIWEKQSGSEDLLFNELMVWGYIHRLRKQRRLASAANLVDEGSASTSREQKQLLERLVSAMETRDPYLHGHSRRVARHAWMIAQRMKLPREEVARIRVAAALHDVGKTKTPKVILHKAGRLSDEEYRIIKLHPAEGAEMVSVLHDPELASIIRHHHERLDGSGYPDGLAGEAIPLGARIIAVADTFDAITSARPYRLASPHKRAIDILHTESGTRLDPDVVRAFCVNYAGRRPLALWSFVCGIPERIVTWLSASVGAVASAAKVVAVAAVVGGGAAATGSALGPTSSHSAGPSHASASSAHASGSGTTTTGTAVFSSASHALRSAPSHPAGALAHRHVARLRTLPVVAPRHGDSSGTEDPRVISGRERRTSPGGGSGTGNEEQTTKGKSEETQVVKHEEVKIKKEEPAPKPGEAPAAKTEEHGKSSEAPGHAGKEEAPVATTPEPVPGSGSEEKASHGKSGEAPTHGKG